MFTLQLEPLTDKDFAKYGQVLDKTCSIPFQINQGFADRFNDLAFVDIDSQLGKPNISVFTARPRPLPVQISLMERHPLGSQLFYPLQNVNWIVVVCDAPLDVQSYKAFWATGAQGVNYARNVWHHPLIVVGDVQQFIVVDRKGPGNNFEEVPLAAPLSLVLDL